jgi:2-polyprenyl-3-methyl-5-hydroxy-6-metoxy-1,4-benzoquinol methylase
MVSVDDRPLRALRPRELASLAASIYRDSPPFRKLLMTLRPYICPFERLIQCVPEGAAVLDVGCGAGLFLGLLAATGHRFRGVGFDASGSAIREATAMAAQLKAQGGPGELRFEHIDVRAAWPEGTFDVVSIIDVMHHVPLDHRQALLEQAQTALVPGGLLIFKDIGIRPRWRATANRFHDLVLAREWVQYTPLRDVEAWCCSRGLQPLTSETMNRLWYGHELVLFRNGSA